MSARGGKRPGAGRKPGVPNRATAEKRAEIEASGLTPLDYMLKLLRDEEMPRDVRLDAAKSAAPYVHPRLSAIEANVAISDHEDFISSFNDEPEGDGGSGSSEG